MDQIFFLSLFKVISQRQRLWYPQLIRIKLKFLKIKIKKIFFSHGVLHLRAWKQKFWSRCFALKKLSIDKFAEGTKLLFRQVNYYHFPLRTCMKDYYIYVRRIRWRKRKHNFSRLPGLTGEIMLTFFFFSLFCFFFIFLVTPNNKIPFSRQENFLTML